MKLNAIFIFCNVFLIILSSCWKSLDDKIEPVYTKPKGSINCVEWFYPIHQNFVYYYYDDYERLILTRTERNNEIVFERHYVYDDMNNLISMKGYSINSLYGETLQEHELYSYDNEKKLIQTEYYDGTYDTHNYNYHDNLINVFKWKKKPDNTFYIRFRLNYEYDSLNHDKIRFENFFLYDSSEDSVLIHKYEYLYNDQSQLIEKRILDGYQLIPGPYSTYEYNNKDKLYIELFYQEYGGNFEPFEGYKYIYF